jgi:hypothetical protein
MNRQYAKDAKSYEEAMVFSSPLGIPGVLGGSNSRYLEEG